jgi:hypothetical protein
MKRRCLAKGAVHGHSRASERPVDDGKIGWGTVLDASAAGAASRPYLAFRAG